MPAVLPGPVAAERSSAALPDPAPVTFPLAPLERAVPSARRVRRRGRFFGDVLRVSVFAFVFYGLFFNLSVVRGSSMAPGIQDGDRILVEPWSYFFSPIRRGDVVVLRYPLDPDVDYIKRIIGVPGDEVALADGKVWVNGELLEEPYVERVDQTSFLAERVAPGHYFVLGDNRPRSSDSREFGLVPEVYLRGRVDLRLWPLARAGWVE